MASKNIIDVLIRADDKASAALAKSQQNVKNYSASLATSFNMLAAAGAAVSAAIAGIVFKTGTWADQMGDLAQSFGVSTEFLSRMEHVTRTSGSSIEEFLVGLRTMTRQSIQQGTATDSASNALNRLGVNARTASGSIKPLEQLFFEIVDQISKLPSESDRAAYALEIFGRSGNKLIPAIRGGSKALQELMSETDKLGGTLSGKTAAAADKFADSLGKIKTALRGVGIVIFDELAPGITSYTERLAFTIPKLSDFISKHGDLLAVLVKTAGVLAVGAGGATIAVQIAKLGAAFGVAIAPALGFAAAIAGVVAGLVALKHHTGGWFTGNIMPGDEEMRLLNEHISKMQAAKKRLSEMAAEAQRKPAAAAGGAALPPELDWKEIDKLEGSYSRLSASMAKAFTIITDYEQETGLVNPAFDQMQAAIHSLDVTGLEVAQNLARNIGSAFAQVITGAQSAAEAFKSAFLNAIGSVIARLMEMAVMQAVGSFLPFLLFHGGGEIPRARRGLEIAGGYSGMDSTPALVSRGEVVMPSPTVSRLNQFLDTLESGAQQAVNVTVAPLLFTGSKDDAYMAANYVRRRLEVQERFVIEGAL